jgi:uncharacterized protein
MNFKNTSFAVVGASNNPEKYGHKVLQALLKRTKNIFPINPKEKEILGFNCYNELSNVKEKIDIIIFVVPPLITLEMLEKNFARKSLFWFQEGSFNEEVIRFCEVNGIEYESKKCIIKESEKN